PHLLVQEMKVESNHNQVMKRFGVTKSDARIHGVAFLVHARMHHEDNDMNHFVVVVGIPYDLLAHLVSQKQISMNWSAQNVYSLGDIPSH
ncbi:hypothetical protein, partial [Escherichia coli]|uniref:hypothetical protein n=1 Tax=Escherichia coli TaxID=562 RepID=UPI0037549278